VLGCSVSFDEFAGAPTSVVLRCFHTPLFSVDDRTHLRFGTAELDGAGKEVGLTDAQHLKLRNSQNRLSRGHKAADGSLTRLKGKGNLHEKSTIWSSKKRRPGTQHRQSAQGRRFLKQ
jgi:hypothetical protein